MNAVFFDVQNTPRIGQAVWTQNGEMVTVTSLMGVIADALYDTKEAWIGFSRDDGSGGSCSMYTIRSFKQ